MEFSTLTHHRRLRARHAIIPARTNSTVYLDSAYNGKPCQAVLTEHALIGEIAAKGVPAPIQVGKRRVVESRSPG